MNEAQLFMQMKMWRNWTVEFLRTIPENIADQIPAGHHNNIRFECWSSISWLGSYRFSSCYTRKAFAPILSCNVS